MRLRALICLAALASFPGLAHAGGLTFTQDVIANFEFDVLGGTAFNPGQGTGWLPYEAVGQLTFTLDPSINDPTATTVPFTNVQGTLDGVYQQFLLPFTISPDLQFIGGDLTNIVRDGSGNITSADVSNLASQWDLIAGGGSLVFFTADSGGLPFNGAVTSVPFANGTVLSGPDQFNVYMNIAGADVLVAYGEDRTLTMVPEPASATLGGLALLTMGVAAVRRRRRG